MRNAHEELELNESIAFAENALSKIKNIESFYNIVGHSLLCLCKKQMRCM